jgi:trigger factor
MNIESKQLSETLIELSIIADQTQLAEAKSAAIAILAPKVKVDGFRAGKVPLSLAEKHINPASLQNEFLEEAINKTYLESIKQEQLRPVANPDINIVKFVPYTTLEFRAKVEIIGKIKLPNYKIMSLKKADVKVSAKDIQEVLERLQTQTAEYKEVERPIKDGDRAIIDFSGKDEKGQVVSGADGKDFPLSIGSKTFIPGFEENLIGLKKDDKKTFNVTFPQDYHFRALQSKKVYFAVTVKKVEDVIKHKLDDEFAAKAGPFKTLKELKDDILKQLKLEREAQAERDFEDSIIKKIVEKTIVSLPASLLKEQTEAVGREFEQNLAYRGQKLDDYLAQKNISKGQFEADELRPAAEQRLKAGLVLSEIANKENIEVSPEEVEIRRQVLKGRYSDPKMQEELNNPNSNREIANRLLTEKTIHKLVGYLNK